MNVPKVFIIDYCQTIVKIDSLPSFIKFVCFNEKGLRTLCYIWYWLLMRLGFSVNKSKRIGLLASLDAKTLSTLSMRFNDEVIKPNLNLALIEYLNRNRKKDDVVIIVSAAIADYIEYIKEVLDVDEIIAARLDIGDGEITTGTLDKPLVYGQLKVEQFTEYLKERDMLKSYSIGISDSIHDLPMLEWADMPIVIDGVCSQLVSMAKEKEWKLL